MMKGKRDTTYRYVDSGAGYVCVKFIRYQQHEAGHAIVFKVNEKSNMDASGAMVDTARVAG